MRFGSRGPSEFATEMPWPKLRGKTPYLLKIANINPQQEATLSLWKKKKFPEREAEMEMGLGLHLKSALPNVRKEPH